MGKCPYEDQTSEACSSETTHRCLDEIWPQLDRTSASGQSGKMVRNFAQTPQDTRTETLASLSHFSRMAMVGISEVFVQEALSGRFAFEAEHSSSALLRRVIEQTRPARTWATVQAGFFQTRRLDLPG